VRVELAWSTHARTRATERRTGDLNVSDGPERLCMGALSPDGGTDCTQYWSRLLVGPSERTTASILIDTIPILQGVGILGRARQKRRYKDSLTSLDVCSGPEILRPQGVVQVYKWEGNKWLGQEGLFQPFFNNRDMVWPNAAVNPLFSPDRNLLPILYSPTRRPKEHSPSHQH